MTYSVICPHLSAIVKTMKRRLGLALKFAITTFLIVFLLNAVGLEDVIARLKTVSYPLVLLSLLIAAFQFLISTVRWRVVLQALDTSLGFSKAFQIVCIGVFFNQVLPGSVGGDAVRVYKSVKAGLPLGTSINGVVLDRLATVLGLVLLSAFCLPFLLDRMDNPLPTWLLPLVIVACMAGTALLMMLDRLPMTLRRWRLVRALGHIALHTRLVFLHPVFATQVLLLAVLGHINISMVAWVLGLSMGLGDQLSLLECLALIPVVLLITTLPISIAGWGVREGAMVGILGSIGIASDSALMLSILFGVTTVAISLPGGLVWLASSDRRMPKDLDMRVDADVLG